jgi:hypothetical protein
LVSFPDLAGLEKDGAWELATLSFPAHWHLAPSFTRRVSLAVSFPTLRWSCMNDCKPFRPRSGAGRRCHHHRRSGETSQPGVHTPAGALRPDPVRMRSENECIVAISARSASDVSGHDRWPHATGLVSYPSSCVFSLKQTTPFWRPPANRILSPLRGHRRPSSAFASDRSIRDSPYPFSLSGCDAGLIQRHVLFVQNRRIADHHTGSQ